MNCQVRVALRFSRIVARKLFHGDHTLIDDTVGVGTNDAPTLQPRRPYLQWLASVDQHNASASLLQVAGARVARRTAADDDVRGDQRSLVQKQQAHLETLDCEISMLPPSRL